MLKSFFVVGIIICLNLLAFFCVWNILDTLFWKEGVFTLLFVVLSIIPLVFFLSFYLKKTLKEMSSIHNPNDTQHDSTTK